MWQIAARSPKAAGGSATLSVRPGAEGMFAGPDLPLSDSPNLQPPIPSTRKRRYEIRRMFGRGQVPRGHCQQLDLQACRRHAKRQGRAGEPESTGRAGLMGFEPTTAGLKVRCATWLRYRPVEWDATRAQFRLFQHARLFVRSSGCSRCRPAVSGSADPSRGSRAGQASAFGLVCHPLHPVCSGSAGPEPVACGAQKHSSFK